MVAFSRKPTGGIEHEVEPIESSVEYTPFYRTIPPGEVRHIGIDESSLRKGHEYMTIATDLENERILHAVKGKSKENIRPFREMLSRKAKNRIFFEGAFDLFHRPSFFRSRTTSSRRGSSGFAFNASSIFAATFSAACFSGCS